MLRDLVNQKPQNISLDPDLTPDLAEKMQTRFVCKAEVRRVRGVWYVKETVDVGAENCDSDDEREITTRLRDLSTYQDARDSSRADALVYVPPFVVRGVSIDDSDTTGRRLFYDMPYFTYGRDRWFAGLDRPEGITMLYLDGITNGVCEATFISLKG